MILVTGGTGNVGRHLVAALANERADFKVLTRDAERAAELLHPGVELIEGDLGDFDSTVRAMKGADRLFLLTSASPELARLQVQAIRAARQSGMGRVVKLSTVGASRHSKMSLARWHAQVEEELARSGLAWTLLQPTYFMQNLLRLAPTIVGMGELQLPLGSARLAMIDCRDIAAVALRCLLEEGHAGKRYVLTGPEALSMEEVARGLTDALSIPIRYLDVSEDRMRENLRRTGTPDWYVRDLIAMYAAFRAGYGGKVTDEVARVGRVEPHSFEEFAADFREDFYAAAAELAAEELQPGAP